VRVFSSLRRKRLIKKEFVIGIFPIGENLTFPCLAQMAGCRLLRSQAISCPAALPLIHGRGYARNRRRETASRSPFLFACLLERRHEPTPHRPRANPRPVERFSARARLNRTDCEASISILLSTYVHVDAIKAIEIDRTVLFRERSLAGFRPFRHAFREMSVKDTLPEWTVELLGSVMTVIPRKGNCIQKSVSFSRVFHACCER